MDGLKCLGGGGYSVARGLGWSFGWILSRFWKVPWMRGSESKGVWYEEGGLEEEKNEEVV